MLMQNPVMAAAIERILAQKYGLPGLPSPGQPPGAGSPAAGAEMGGLEALLDQAGGSPDAAQDASGAPHGDSAQDSPMMRAAKAKLGGGAGGAHKGIPVKGPPPHLGKGGAHAPPFKRR